MTSENYRAVQGRLLHKIKNGIDGDTVESLEILIKLGLHFHLPEVDILLYRLIDRVLSRSEVGLLFREQSIEKAILLRICSIFLDDHVSECIANYKKIRYSKIFNATIPHLVIKMVSYLYHRGNEIVSGYGDHAVCMLLIFCYIGPWVARYPEIRKKIKEDKKQFCVWEPKVSSKKKKWVRRILSLKGNQYIFSLGEDLYPCLSHAGLILNRAASSSYGYQKRRYRWRSISLNDNITVYCN